MKKIINIIVSLSLLSGVSLVFAHGHGDEELAQVRENLKGAVTEKVTEKREAVKSAAGERREALKNATAERKEAAKSVKTEFRAKLETEREAFKQKVETAKEEFQKKREVEKEALKARLEKVKDEKKKAAVERLDNRFTEINTKQTNHLLNTLTRLEELLAKVSSRADKVVARGVDVSAVRTAIEKAKAEIAAARTVLEAQLKKTYLIQVTDEARLKSAVAVAREALNKDLKAAREAVQKAHKAVVEANRLLKGVPKVDEEIATSTSGAAQ